MRTKITPPKKTNGRPLKYHDNFPEIARRLLSYGFTDKQVYETLGVTEQCGIQWRKKYPEFQKVFEEHHENIILQVENSLFKKALGYEYDEKYYEPIYDKKTGKNTHKMKLSRVIKKHVPPSDSAIQFALSNIYSEKYQDRKNISINNNVNQAALMTPDERHNWLIEHADEIGQATKLLKDESNIVDVEIIPDEPENSGLTENIPD